MSFLGNILGGFSNGVSSGNPLGMIGGLFGGFAAAEQEADQRNWIKTENQRAALQQFEFAKALQGQAQAFNHREAQLARDWNSLPEQMKRAAAAGINPLAALGANGQSNVSASVSPSSVGLPFVSSAPTGTVDLANLAQALSLSSGARKTEKETTRYDDQLDALIVKLAQDAATSKAEEDSKKLFNDITRVYGKQRASLECIKLLTDAFKAAADGEKAKADKLVSDAVARLTKLRGDEQEAILPFVKQRAEGEVNLLTEQAKTEQHKQSELDASAGAHRASAEESRASAEESRARTTTENELRPSRVGISKAEHSLKNFEVRYKSKAQAKELEKLASELRQQLDEETLTAIERYDAENYSALHRLLFSSERKGTDVGKALKLLSKYGQYLSK